MARHPGSRYEIACGLFLRLLGLVYLIAIVSQLANAFRVRVDLPDPLLALYRTTLPARSINSYGLFAVMTTERPEIVVEGSEDGREWKVYRFRFKPGELDEAPRVLGPHMPRLDWQMWFAALGSYRRSPWFVADARAETGAWWRREDAGEYLPTVTREQLLEVRRQQRCRFSRDVSDPVVRRHRRVVALQTQRAVSEQRWDQPFRSRPSCRC